MDDSFSVLWTLYLLCHKFLAFDGLLFHFEAKDVQGPDHTCIAHTLCINRVLPLWYLVVVGNIGF